MFSHLLIPLDGSKLAESVLPTAVCLAGLLQTRITLIHIVEKNPPQEIHSDRHLSNPEEALAYLNEIARTAFPADIVIEKHVHSSPTKDIPKGITEHAREFDSDLVLMCTHGSSGLRNFVFGSIAQQVIAARKVPVLILPPDGEKPVCVISAGKYLVPLDGDPEHERVLKIALEFAQAAAASLHLVMVVPTQGTLSGKGAAAGMLLPSTTRILLDLNVQAAREYLDGCLAQVQGVKTSSEIARGDPATVIAELARKNDTDLIILGTHGKSGMDAFWAGSIAPKILQSLHRPMLLVPV